MLCSLTLLRGAFLCERSCIVLNFPGGDGRRKALIPRLFEHIVFLILGNNNIIIIRGQNFVPRLPNLFFNVSVCNMEKLEIGPVSEAT